MKLDPYWSSGAGHNALAFVVSEIRESYEVPAMVLVVITEEGIGIAGSCDRIKMLPIGDSPHDIVMQKLVELIEEP